MRSANRAAATARPATIPATPRPPRSGATSLFFSPQGRQVGIVQRTLLEGCRKIEVEGLGKPVPRRLEVAQLASVTGQVEAHGGAGGELADNAQELFLGLGGAAECVQGVGLEGPDLGRVRVVSGPRLAPSPPWKFPVTAAQTAGGLFKKRWTLAPARQSGPRSRPRPGPLTAQDCP